jgi:hypothetical protein
VALLARWERHKLEMKLDLSAVEEIFHGEVSI